MSKRTRNAAIAYVRGEPMDAAERSRLEDELSCSAPFREMVEEQRALSADLDALRRARRDLAPPAALETILSRRLHAPKRPQSRRTAWRRAWPGAAAAATVLLGVIAFDLLRPGRMPEPEPGPPAVVDPAPAYGGFLPLPYGRAIEHGEAYTVIRARLGKMGLMQAGVPLPDPTPDGYVDAELLLGADGTVIGIRFVDPVLSAVRPVSEPVLMEDQI